MFPTTISTRARSRRQARLLAGGYRAGRRTGAAAVLAMLLTIGLVVLTAVTIDYSNIRVANAEVRRATDAAAMAACWEMVDQQIANRSSDGHLYDCYHAANVVASANEIAQQAPTLGSGDVETGRYTLDGNFYPTTSDTNAVRVTLRRQSSVNGEVPLFFGALTGRQSQSLHATAIAAVFNQVIGFEVPAADVNLGILPIALDEPSWFDALAGNTVDNWAFANGQLQSGSDGFHEVNLYPKGTGAPGNRGTVDIGGANNSTSDLSRQVLYGISRQDLMDLGKPLKLGANGVLDLNGDTGISAGIKDELATLIGKTRIIPIFSKVEGNGNNATFTIVRFEGVRILDVKLTGKKNQKRVIIQPATVIARGARIDDSGTFASSHLITPVMLVE